MRHFRHKLASWAFPKYSTLLDNLNYNARLATWLSQQKSVPVLSDRESMYRFINQTYVGDRPIDYLEFGVFQGASIRAWTSINRHADSHFIGFDCFSGLPEDWGRCRAGQFNVDGKIPEIDDNRVEFVAGIFQKTLPGFLQSFTPQNQLVINNDSDLYSSTLYTLAKLDGIIAPGTILIFDEYFSPLHEPRAMQDYLQSFQRKARPIAITDDVHGRVAFIFD